MTTKLQAEAQRIAAEGRDAYRLGQKLEDNPYFGTRNAIHWAEGFKAEDQLSKEEVDDKQGETRGA